MSIQGIQFNQLDCVAGDIFWTISEKNFFPSSYFKVAIITLQMQGNYPTYFPCVGIYQSHCRNIRLKETTSGHQVLVPAVSSSRIIDLHSINGTWCVPKVVRLFLLSYFTQNNCSRSSLLWWLEMQCYRLIYILFCVWISFSLNTALLCRLYI